MFIGQFCNARPSAVALVLGMNDTGIKGIQKINSAYGKLCLDAVLAPSHHRGCQIVDAYLGNVVPDPEKRLTQRCQHH